jgi:hypothetical protein
MREQELEPLKILERSRALWNRNRLALESDEILAQILDRGSLDDWRALYRLVAGDDDGARRLRERIHRVLLSVPTGLPYFWLAALAGLGHDVDWTVTPRVDEGLAEI